MNSSPDMRSVKTLILFLEAIVDISSMELELLGTAVRIDAWLSHVATERSGTGDGC